MAIVEMLVGDIFPFYLFRKGFRYCATKFGFKLLKSDLTLFK